MMKKAGVFLMVLSCLVSFRLLGQTVKLKQEMLEAVGVNMSFVKLGGNTTVQVVKDSAVKEVDEPTFVKLKGRNFKDGTIEVNVLSKLRPDAPAHARGFIGVAFRVNDDNSKFECIYIRPTNGRADDQIRRNHSIQYFSYPDHKFSRLRKESPEKYESYADMYPNANHGFHNDTTPRYDKAAAELAWKRTVEFFNEKLK